MSLEQSIALLGLVVGPLYVWVGTLSIDLRKYGERLGRLEGIQSTIRGLPATDKELKMVLRSDGTMEVVEK